jgi:hypothetical protein
MVKIFECFGNKGRYGTRRSTQVNKFNRARKRARRSPYHCYFYEKVVKVKADVAAILIFFPGRNRPRLETSAETGRGMAQGGCKPLLRGEPQQGPCQRCWLARNVSRRGGNLSPPRLSPGGKRERGIRFHAAAGSSMLRRLYAHRCFPMLLFCPSSLPMTVTNIFVLSILSPLDPLSRFSRSLAAAPTACRASICTLNGPRRARCKLVSDLKPRSITR